MSTCIIRKPQSTKGTVKLLKASTKKGHRITIRMLTDLSNTKVQAR